MSDRIVKKVYYRYDFTLQSAMNVGNGENDVTDKDVITDALGRPFIPGTSMAGVFREHILQDLGQKAADYYFGKRTIGNRREDSSDSRIITYDATLGNPKGYKISRRDGVHLDEFKTAVEGAKYDFQIVEPGSRFVTYIEQDITEPDYEDIGALIADLWMTQGLDFGFKTTRGLGHAVCETGRVYRKEFNLATQAAEWLNFDIYDEKAWNENDTYKVGDCVVRTGTTIELTLRQEGGISIRRYTTKISLDENASAPDYEQLCDGNGIPIIPGTSWAGAFRHHIEGIMHESVDEFFGYVRPGAKESENKKRSSISFNDSTLSGGGFKTITRNAIDRFTGGTIDGALYTEKTYYGGTCTLTIRLSGRITDTRFKRVLACAIMDLHLGILSVGGLTAVGRGIFSIDKLTVNNSDTVPLPDSDNLVSDDCKRTIDAIVALL